VAYAARSVAAGEFKAKCLELLDRVARDGDAIVVTKRGRPVAKVVPVEPRVQRSLRGSVRYLSDVVAAIGDEWTVSGNRVL
jgi:prevent-host-death family protein